MTAPAMRECWRCDGTGGFDRRCSTCSGRGEVRLDRETAEALDEMVLDLEYQILAIDTACDGTVGL